MNYHVIYNLATLGFTDPEEAYSTLTSSLAAAVDTGAFNEAIITAASEAGVSTPISTVTSTGLTVHDAEVVPNPTDDVTLDNMSTHEFGAVVACVIVSFILLAALIYCLVSMQGGSAAAQAAAPPAKMAVEMSAV